MMDCIAQAQGFLSGVDESSFEGSDLMQSAVAHQVKVLAHIAGLVSRPLRDAYPEVPWSSITGMRHRIVHDYINVNPRMVWIVVHDDLPGLQEQLVHILQSLESHPHAT